MTSHNKLFDSYILIARILPSIVTLIPFFVFWFYIFKIESLKPMLDFFDSINFFGSISISMVLLFFYSQMIRHVSKTFEDKYFNDKDDFPTTYLMLYTNTSFSKAFKDKYRDYVKSDFGLKLYRLDQEKENINEARKLLNDAFRQIIPLYRNKGLIKSQNQIYGFWRNLIGGCVFSASFCLSNIIYGMFISPEKLLVYISILILLLSLIPILLSKSILKRASEDYAKQLFNEYLSRR